MPITLKTNAIKVKDSQGTYQSVDCIKGDPGEVTQAEFDELSEDVNNLKSAINSMEVQCEVDQNGDAIMTLGEIDLSEIEELVGGNA